MSPRKRCRPTPAVSSTTAPGVAQCCKPSPGTAVCSVHTAACRVRRSSSNATAADARRGGEPRHPSFARCVVILRRPAQYTPVDGASRRQVELQMHSAADDVNSASSNTSPNPVSARSTHPFWEVFARTALDTFAPTWLGCCFPAGRRHGRFLSGFPDSQSILFAADVLRPRPCESRIHSARAAPGARAAGQSSP